MSEKLIKPAIFVDKGCCPNCLSVLKIYESEFNAITIDSNGLPRDIENERVNIIGLCENCGMTFDMVKIGMHYEPYSKFKSIIREEKIKSLNKTDNPFGFDDEGDK